VDIMYLNTSQKEKGRHEKNGVDVNSEEPIEYLSSRRKQTVLCGVGKVSCMAVHEEGTDAKSSVGMNQEQKVL